MEKLSVSLQSTPKAAFVLGALGLLPFILSVIILKVLEDIPAGPVHFALITYGALILSFLGGIQWGLATVRSESLTPEPSVTPQFMVSVVPSLIGWAALLVPISIGYFVLAVAFAAVLTFDMRMAKQSHVPGWYIQLRLALTLVVVPCLLAGGIAAS